jgi:histidyl-tRNA synthetase
MDVSEVTLRLSSLGSAEARTEYRELLQQHLHANEESLSEDVRSRIDSNPLRAFDSDHPGTVRAMESAPRLLDHLSTEDTEHFAQVRDLLDAANVPYEIDSTLVRGLDYYTRTVFEFTSQALGAQSGVGGGGRYDRLVEQLGGPPTPGMGWAAGIERILLAGEPSEVGQPPVATALELFVAREEAGAQTATRAFTLVEEARSAGLTAQMDLGRRSLKGQLGAAGSLGARYVAIVGGDGSLATLRDMQGGGQREIATDAIVHAVLRGHHEL